MVSIIIPVYNAGAYLEGCVRSILDLKIEKEVIVVDDGSTDNAVDEGRWRIKIIRQENQGVSAARNRGLKEATGEWVWFVDADDIIEPQILAANKKSLISSWREDEALAESSAETVLAARKPRCCSLTTESPENTEKDDGRWKMDDKANFVVTGFAWEENGKMERYGASEGEIPYNLWRCWFRRDVIEKHGLRFTVGRKYAEDQEFILKYLLAVGQRKTVALPELVYHYTVRPGSAMTRPGVKRKQVLDIASVIFAVGWRALLTGNFSKGWAWKELKRLTKTLMVTVERS